MGEVSKIGWTKSTFNAWSGCIGNSPCCKNCFAEAESLRFPLIRGTWGPEGIGVRVARVDNYWLAPLNWNRKAAKTGEFWPVFAFSNADVFEQWGGPIHDHRGDVVTDLTMDDIRIRFFDLVRQTPYLTWLVLTKWIGDVMGTLRRIRDRINQLMPLWSWLDWWIEGALAPKNVWLGCTAENQEWADRRVPDLLKIPNVCPWVSYEPAIGQVDWRRWIAPMCSECGHSPEFRRKDGSCAAVGSDSPWGNRCHRDGLRWIVCGGESGDHARPFDLSWARSTIKQCRDASVACFVKQLGANAVNIGRDDGSLEVTTWGFKHRAGADPAEWPSDLVVQEFPKVAA